MIRIPSENDLLAMFRPIDRAEVRVPSDMKFPLAVTDYTAWIEPSGHRAFLVFEDANSRDGRGFVFKRSHPSGEPTVQMCEWCHSVGGGNQIGMLTAASSAKRRVGLNLCRDLSCKDNIAEQPPNVNDLRESLSAHEKRVRLMGRVIDFARRNLY